MYLYLYNKKKCRESGYICIFVARRNQSCTLIRLSADNMPDTDKLTSNDKTAVTYRVETSCSNVTRQLLHSLFMRETIYGLAGPMVGPVEASKSFRTNIDQISPVAPQSLLSQPIDYYWFNGRILTLLGLIPKQN